LDKKRRKIQFSSRLNIHRVLPLLSLFYCPKL